jgi:propanediol dehydratase small subunit
MSVLDKLTEGIVDRNLKQEGDALLRKWEKTGLLEGIDSDNTRHGMARLLENQAKQLLKEAAGSAMAQGDVEGFASVAFPLVRRVFGGLLANDLVSVQPMSLPSGLIFFLDFTFGDTRVAAGAVDGESVFGQGIVGSQITGGVTLDDTQDTTNMILAQERGFYNLVNGYASPTGSLEIADLQILGSGTAGRDYTGDSTAKPDTFNDSYTDLGKVTQFDPDLSGTYIVFGRFSTTDAGLVAGQLTEKNLTTLHHTGGFLADHKMTLVKRLTRPDPITANNYLVVWAATGSVTAGTTDINLVESLNHGTVATTAASILTGMTFTCAIDDKFTTHDEPGGVVGAATWGLEDNTFIPEIDIRVDSIAVTAQTKKLKAKWTPELGQDLNAYHNLDAEVELTSILSEQIALEIDREILTDLLKGATAGTLYWARSPGLFVNRETGAEVGASSAAPDFTGTVSEWYETLIETINDVSARIHRKTLRGGANFVVCSPEVANILEFTAGFRASVTVDDTTGQIGAVKTGSLSKKFDVYVDPYFPRNVLLVGRRGSSFLESGYVYAPYVPLQVTPTIFGTEDFVPRKGVMTRYAKKMVRPDMYGLVVVRGLLGEEGSS